MRIAAAVLFLSIAVLILVSGDHCVHHSKLFNGDIQAHQIVHMLKRGNMHGPKFSSGFHKGATVKNYKSENKNDVSNPNWVVQMKLPITEKALSVVKSAILPYELGQYVPHGGFMLTAPVDIVERLMTETSVIDIKEYHHSLKVRSNMNEILNENYVYDENSKVSEIQLYVLLSKDKDRNSSKTKEFVDFLTDFSHSKKKEIDPLNCLSSLSFSFVSSHALMLDAAFHPTENCFIGKNQTAALDPLTRVIDLISLRNEITWIEPKRNVRLFNRYVSGIVQSGNTETPFWSKLLNGKDEIVSISDTGIDFDSCFFSDPNYPVPINSVNKNHRKIVSYQDISSTLHSIGDEENGHGTHVAGTVAGFVSKDIDSYASAYNGMAPAAKIAFFDLGTNSELQTPRDLASGYLSKAYELGSRISSNSWGSEGKYYSTESFQVDDFIWKNQDFVIAFAAGNSGFKGYGSVGVPANAKNVITVGASRSSAKSFSDGGYLDGIEILGDSSLFNLSIGRAQFGGRFSKLKVIEKKIVFAEPLDGCSPLINSNSVSGNVVFIKRGKCFFEEKASFAQAAGAAMAVIFNDKAGIIGEMASRGLKISKDINIPCISISKDSGDKILEFIKKSPNLSLRGPIEISSPDFRVGKMAEFSSIGPTIDGRIKPDIVAPGEYVYSARSDGNLKTNQCGGTKSVLPMAGTSMATPVVSGFSAIIRQYFAEGWHVNGSKTPKNPHNPTAALVKAVLINSGEEVDGKVGDLLVEGPISVFQGFGQIRLDKVLPLGDHLLKFWFRDLKGSDGLQTMDTFRSCFKISEQEKGHELRASLVWTDPPAANGAFFALVNNLDLSLSHVESNSVYLGNGIYYTDTRGKNHIEWDFINNVEQVRLEAANSGHYLLQVHGTHVPQGPQPFAVVMNGAFEQVDVSKCSSLLCPNDCSGNGVCADGYCQCDNHHHGPDCSISAEVIDMKNNTFVRKVLLNAGAWEFFEFDLTQEMKLSKSALIFNIVRSSSLGDPDLYISRETFPSLINYDYALLEPGNSKTTQLKLDLSKASSGNYKIGVYAYCCDEVEVELTIKYL